MCILYYIRVPFRICRFCRIVHDILTAIGAIVQTATLKNKCMNTHAHPKRILQIKKKQNKLLSGPCYINSFVDYIQIVRVDDKSQALSVLLFYHNINCQTFRDSMDNILYADYISCKCVFDVFTLAVNTVYPKKYPHGFVVLCFVVVMQSFKMNSHEVFIHIHQGCFAGTGAIVRLPQCQWSKPDGYGKISQCITTTKHSKAKIVCIFLGIYCSSLSEVSLWMAGFGEFKRTRHHFQCMTEQIRGVWMQLLLSRTVPNYR